MCAYIGQCAPAALTCYAVLGWASLYGAYRTVKSIPLSTLNSTRCAAVAGSSRMAVLAGEDAAGRAGGWGGRAAGGQRRAALVQAAQVPRSNRPPARASRRPPPRCRLQLLAEAYLLAMVRKEAQGAPGGASRLPLYVNYQKEYLCEEEAGGGQVGGAGAGGECVRC
jgi:hypothetical protein